MGAHERAGTEMHDARCYRRAVIAGYGNAGLQGRQGVGGKARAAHRASTIDEKKSGEPREEAALSKLRGNVHSKTPPPLFGGATADLMRIRTCRGCQTGRSDP